MVDINNGIITMNREKDHIEESWEDSYREQLTEFNPKLDLSKAALVALEKYSLDPGSDTYKAISELIVTDAQLRKTLLKARSVIAAAYRYGHLSAVYQEYKQRDRTVPYIIIGQESSLATAITDLADLIRLPGVGIEPHYKALVPILLVPTGWRAQFGWIAIRDPLVEDQRTLYNWLRSSFSWFDENPRSLDLLLQARGLTQEKPLRDLKAIFEETLSSKY